MLLVLLILFCYCCFVTVVLIVYLRDNYCYDYYNENIVLFSSDYGTQNNIKSDCNLTVVGGQTNHVLLNLLPYV